jgi:hypothetical protein
MAGMTVLMFGVPREKKRVACLKIYEEEIPAELLERDYREPK